MPDTRSAVSAAIDQAAHAPARRGPDPLATLRALEPQIRRALAGQLDPDRFLRVAQTEIRLQPRLLTANSATLFGALVTAAQLGLDLTRPLGQAHLEVRDSAKRGEAEVILGIDYRGWITLALRSGQITSIEATAVREADAFEWERGTSPFLRHRFGRGERGEVVAAWALATFKSGASQFVVLDREAIDKRRGHSPSDRRSKGSSGPWAEWFEEMASKTAVRALVRQLPLTAELAAAHAVDERPRDDTGSTLEEWASLPEAEPEPEPAPRGPKGRARRPRAPEVTAEVDRSEESESRGDGAPSSPVESPVPPAEPEPNPRASLHDATDELDQDDGAWTSDVDDPDDPGPVPGEFVEPSMFEEYPDRPLDLGGQS